MIKLTKLPDNINIKTLVISQSNNPFGDVALEKIKKLSTKSPYLKPVEIDGEYFTFKLVKVIPSKIKSFEDAKALVLPFFIEEQKKTKLIKLATASVDTFKGKTTEFITSKDAIKITDISVLEGNDFLKQLFNTQKKRGFISLKDGKVVLYNILEQKMLKDSNINQDDSIKKIKSAMFNEGLLKNLQNKYKTEIFIQGL